MAKGKKETKKTESIRTEKGWESYDPNRNQKIAESVRTEKGWESYDLKPKGTQSGHSVTSVDRKTGKSK